MEKTLFFFIFPILLAVRRSFSQIPKEDNKTQHDNCLTWHDDKQAIFLTCRITNFSLPVTFHHIQSNTEVECNINVKEQHCMPKEKKISINRYKHTVTIILQEYKLGRNLNGKWNCKQGTETKTTEVSISQGIIIDSWVLLRGVISVNANGSKYINLQCSSCRKPQGLYAEFLSNGTTIGSVYQDDQGYCVYGQSKCLKNICGCKPTGNMYYFRYEMKESNTSIDFACDMQFSDNYRRGKFSITASARYTGTDFSFKEYETVVIKNNTIVTVDEINDNNNIVSDRDLVTVTVSDITTDQESLTGKGVNLTVHIVIFAVVIFCLVVVIVIITTVLIDKMRHPNNTGNGT